MNRAEPYAKLAEAAGVTLDQARRVMGLALFSPETVGVFNFPSAAVNDPQGALGLTRDELTRLSAKFAQGADFTDPRDCRIYDALLSTLKDTPNG